VIRLEGPSGTAEAGEDYTDFPHSITIPAGQSSTDFSVTPLDDGQIEPHETLAAAIKPDPNGIYAVGNARAEAQILDNDVRIILIGGHGQGDPNDPMRLAPGVGLWGLRTELIERGFHADNIVMFAEDHGNCMLNGTLALTHVIMQIIVDAHNAGDRQFGLAMVGYSHGGGLVYEVSQQLPDPAWHLNGRYDFSFAGYIDAVDRPGPGPETHRPVGVDFHMNYYQSRPNADLFTGTFIAGADVNYDFDAMVDSQTHTSIDDNQVVHDDFANAILARLG